MFAKGHGTENDFVVLLDPGADLVLSASAVAALCDRRRGLGADGVLRVVAAGSAVSAGILDRLPERVLPGDWFMDYRNADGSVAEMCGNGVRVFAHYLRSAGLVGSADFVVGSRAGARPVTVHSADECSADVTVEMGTVRRLGAGWATVSGRRLTGLGVDVGNPHLACLIPELTADNLADLDIAAAVQFDRAAFPDGVNIEVLTPAVDGVVSMRVHERGVGETRSCGTGTVAAAVAALEHQGARTGALRVRVPGGEVGVEITESTSFLRGPSTIVARGELCERWWAAQG